MRRVVVTREINAPISTVFRVITDIERLPDTNPDIAEVEFLGSQRSGAGAKFRETRSSNGRTMVTELELTECVEYERARFVADTGGTIWDTSFTFREVTQGSGAATLLEIRLDATPHRLLARIMNPLIMGKVRSGMQEHTESLGAYCESLAGSE
ncbi:MAG: hypothetical protein GKS06_20405 [Acidobacteria bacterium]|nr:hypothetical protein [Acidobacteriota bacterium]